MEMTEKQMGALDRMCGHRTGDSYELNGYKVTMLGLDRYQLNFPESPNGDTNSHEFLVQQSGNYIGFESNLEEIEALQLEITQLRRDLLSSQILNIEQITGEKLDIDLDNLGNNPEEIDNAIQDIKKDLNIP